MRKRAIWIRAVTTTRAARSRPCSTTSHDEEKHQTSKRKKRDVHEPRSSKLLKRENPSLFKVDLGEQGRCCMRKPVWGNEYVVVSCDIVGTPGHWQSVASGSPWTKKLRIVSIMTSIISIVSIIIIIRRRFRPRQLCHKTLRDNSPL